MDRSNSLTQDRATPGDSAVDGLFSGTLAGLVMAVILVISGLLVGEPPAVVLGRFSLSGSALSGALTHLAVSGIYGVGYSLIAHFAEMRLNWRLTRQTTILAGMGYGFALWGLAQAIERTSAGTSLVQIPQAAFLLAHLAYGLALGWVAWRVHLGKHS